MKIAVATDSGMVAGHFGRCHEYTIFTVNGDRIESSVVIPNPGHEPGFLPGYLANLGVSCIIAGGMGPRAEGLFRENGIKTVVGASGSVNEVVKAYISGDLKIGESLCDHDNRPNSNDGDHSCDHHHRGA